MEEGDSGGDGVVEERIEEGGCGEWGGWRGEGEEGGDPVHIE